jgi:integrase
MITIYTRHTKACRKQNGPKGRSYAKCGCPQWGYNPETGRRASMGTRNLSLAQGMASAHVEGTPAPKVSAFDPAVTAETAAATYLDYCRAHIRKRTLQRRTEILKAFSDFFPAGAFKNITLQGLQHFQAARLRVAPASALQERTTVRGFFAYCVDHGMIETNLAMKLKVPKREREPTLPFNDDTGETARLLAVVDQLTEWRRPAARAMLLVLEYSGLRISDVMRLRRDAVDTATGRASIKIIKTNRRLPSITLPPIVLEALRALPANGSPYFLSSETEDLETATARARFVMSELGKLAGVVHAHPHRYRDTFTVRLLVRGVDIRTVSLLLGHSSIKVTETFYAPWIPGMQARLDDALTLLVNTNARHDAPDAPSGHPDA